MNYLLLLIMCLFLKWQVEATSEKIKDHLNKKFNNMEQQAEPHIDVMEGIDIQTTKILNENGEEIITAFSIYVFNRLYLLLNRDLYEMNREPKDMDIVKKATILYGNEQITSMKAKEYHNLAFIVMVLDTKLIRVVFFDRNSPKVEKVQTIMNMDVLDTLFLMHDDSLFFITLNNQNNSLSKIMVYKWEMGLFDLQKEIILTAPTRIQSFTDGDHEIILIFQKSSVDMEYCNIYTFDGNNFMKIQRFETESVKKLMPFKHQNFQYVALFGEHTSKIFWWDGFQLTIYLNFTHTSGNMLPLNTNSSMLFLNQNQNNVIIYKAMSNHLVLEKTLNLENATFKSILHYDYLGESQNEVVIIGKTENSEIEIFVVTVKNEIEGNVVSIKDSLLTCLEHLKTELTVDEIDRPFPKKISYKPPAEAQVLPNSPPQAAFSSRNNFNNNAELEELLEFAEVKYEALKPVVEELHYSKDLIIINGKVIAQTLIGKKLTTEDINFRTLKDEKWTPDDWISYSKNQTFPYPMFVRVLNATRIVTTNNEGFLNDLVNANQPIALNGNIKINKLKASNIQTQEINNILIEDVLITDKTKPIKGKKVFNIADISSLKTDEINHEPAEKILEMIANQNNNQEIRYAPNILVDDLEVETVDGVNWRTFSDSVFRLGESDIIKGNLNLPHFGTKFLDLGSLNGDKIEDLMTTSTNQTIYGSIEFNNIFSSNITATKINGITLGEDTISIYDPVIKNPVIIDDITINGNLILNYTEDSTSFLQENEHIFGTNESDLLQIYVEKIKINGNLFLQDLQLSDSASLVIDNEPYTKEFENGYWTKNTNQVIPILVEMEGGITTPQLLTKILNNVNMDDYMVNGKNRTIHTTYSFENVTILGKVNLNDHKTHLPNLKTMEEEAVKLNGNFVVSGRKKFANILNVNQLVSEEINGSKQIDFVTQNDPIIIDGKKVFENLIVEGNFTTNNHSTPNINGINLEELTEKALNINEPIKLDSLNFSSLTVENLHVTSLNGMDIDEYLTNVTNMYQSDVIDILIINGNAVIENLTNTLKINDQDMNSFYLKTVLLNDNKTIYKNIKFEGNVTVNNFIAKYINNVDFPRLTQRILYKTGEQNISGYFTFNNIKAENIKTPSINNLPVYPLVDINSKKTQYLNVPGKITFHEIKTQSLNAENISPCNINQIMSAIQSPLTQSWLKVNITGNVTLLDEECALKRIFDQAVTKHLNNYISAPITFENISSTNTVTVHDINNVNLAHIFADALLIDSDEVQNITGTKTFEKMAIFLALVNGNANIPVVNTIKIDDLDKQIINKDDVHDLTIKGKKVFFGGLQTNILKSNLVNEVMPENLVTLDNTRNVPQIVFDDMTVTNDLNIKEINGVQFTPFIDNILHIHSPTVQEIDAIATFNDLSIPNLMTTHLINNINMEDVVFDDCVQNITATKIFTEDIHIMGNMNVEMLNGFLLSDIYEKAMLTNVESYINGNVKITKPSIINGVMQTTNINGFPIEKINLILNSKEKYLRLDQVRAMTSKIANMTSFNYELIKDMPTEIMYLENSNLLDLTFMDTLNAHIFAINDVVLMNVIGQEIGSYCGLPDLCLCPMQYTMQISPEISVHSFSRDTKRTQRVFSFSNNVLTIHFITNSISSSTYCRTNASKVLNEYSHLTWHKQSNEENTGGIFSHSTKLSGYISAVEYLAIGSDIYIIVAKYYDPVEDSYEYPCEIYKFNENKTNVELIQTIPAYGLWNLHLFFPEQGPVLVLVMKGDPRLKINAVEETILMRFDTQTEQFYHLRSIKAYGNSATGIVIKKNSFIALAQEAAPVLIFKYDDRLKNYVIFQILSDREPILGISNFYIGEGKDRDAYICVVSDNGFYSIYSYRDLDGWQRKFNGRIEGLKNLIPFKSNDNLYLFAPARNVSSILNVVKFGSN